MTQKIIILLFAISVLSPGIGILFVKLIKSSGDAAGKGMTQVLGILIFMLITSLAGGIISSCLWAFSKEPLALYLKVLTVLTYLAPYLFIAITETLKSKA